LIKLNLFHAIFFVLILICFILTLPVFGQAAIENPKQLLIIHLKIRAQEFFQNDRVKQFNYDTEMDLR